MPDNLVPRLNPAKHIFTMLAPRLSSGLFIRLRHAYPSPLRLWRAFRQQISSEFRPRLDDRIVVVGIGPAAMACTEELWREGFTNVTVVAADPLFGGKCVNSGCMPIEFSLGLGSEPLERRGPMVQAFIESLRNDVRKQFESLDYLFTEGTAIAVDGNVLRLNDDRNLIFDRLIVAIGNDYPIPPAVPANLPKLISISEFWTLPPGKQIAIFAVSNASALAMGDAARMLGHKPFVLLAGANPLDRAPSYKYYVREFRKRGIEVHEHVRLSHVGNNHIDFESDGKRAKVDYDHLLVLSKPEPRVIPIDGKAPTIYEIDTVRSSLPRRPDIIFLGDGAGLLTAAEAELQARILMRAWKYGETPDFRAIDHLPICMHGELALGLVGPEWAWLASRWKEVDFRSTGWSKARHLDGKLWYLLDEKSGKIEALHICHKNANELICIGAALLDYPVWDLKWLGTSTHPSAAEIFKVVAGQALAILAAQRHDSRLTTSTPREYRFELPPAHELDPVSGLPDWIDPSQYTQAVISRSPHHVLAAYYGLSRLAIITDKPRHGDIQLTDDGRLLVEGNGDVVIEIVSAPAACRVRQQDIEILISLG